MFALALVCSGLLAASPPPATQVTPEDWKQYESAKAKAGRDPDAHVKLALWCEAHGLNAERTKHLTVAVLTDPKGTVARGLLGLMSYGGRWEKPEAVVQEVKSDEAHASTLARYNAHRDELEAYLSYDRARVKECQAPGKRARLASAQAELNQKLALANIRLGKWCEANGLKPEAMAHFTAATEADPRRGQAWEHLGYRKHKGRWMNQAQIDAEIAEIEAQRHADHHWGPLLSRWKAWLAVRTKRDDAEARLATVNDPRAVPSIWKVFGQRNAADEPRAANLLSGIDSPLATRGLVVLAVFGDSKEARRCAAAAVPLRDPREVIPTLIDTLQSRLVLKFHTKDPAFAERLDQILSPVGGGRAERAGDFPAASRSEGELVIEGKRFNIARSFIGSGSGLTSITDTSAIISTRYREYAIEDQIAKREMIAEAEQDRMMVDRFNAWADSINARAVPLLQSVTGQRLFEDSDEWWQWWADQRGYVYEPPNPEDKPTITSVYRSPMVVLPSTHSACFGAGTPVRTLRGPKPIEEILVGDQVLAQNTKTGELGYRPVSAVRHNPPSTTLRIKVGDETIVATPIHRFWKAGSGWVMARDLNVGDRLRTVGGVTRVASITKEKSQPVFNLDVVADRNFFVGQAAVLVHDHTLVDATTEPFDATPTLR